MLLEIRELNKFLSIFVINFKLRIDTNYCFNKLTDYEKYICTVCDWVYDPEVGDPEGGIAPGTALKIFLKTGFARFAELEKKISR